MVWFLVYNHLKYIKVLLIKSKKIIYFINIFSILNGKNDGLFLSHNFIPNILWFCVCDCITVVLNNSTENLPNILMFCVYQLSLFSYYFTDEKNESQQNQMTFLVHQTSKEWSKYSHLSSFIQFPQGFWGYFDNVW